MSILVVLYTDPVLKVRIWLQIRIWPKRPGSATLIASYQLPVTISPSLYFSNIILYIDITRSWWCADFKGSVSRDFQPSLSSISPVGPWLTTVWHTMASYLPIYSTLSFLGVIDTAETDRCWRLSKWKSDWWKETEGRNLMTLSLLKLDHRHLRLCVLLEEHMLHEQITTGFLKK
jgi:hypothetical protein